MGFWRSGDFSSVLHSLAGDPAVDSAFLNFLSGQTDGVHVNNDGGFRNFLDCAKVQRPGAPSTEYRSMLGLQKKVKPVLEPQAGEQRCGRSQNHRALAFKW